METAQFVRKSEYEWSLPASGAMRVPVVIYASEELLRAMDEKVREQAVNVATLPGIQRASFAMPDAHWGYGFPIGGVAAFDADEGGVVSAGGVGFDISCGVRSLKTGLKRNDIEPALKRLADELSRAIPAGVGSTGRVHLGLPEVDRMLRGGAQWATPSPKAILIPCASMWRCTGSAISGSSGGMTWLSISRTVTESPRCARFSAISKPMNPPPTITALLADFVSIQARISRLSGMLRNTKMPAVSIPGKGGRTAAAPGERTRAS